MISTLLLVSILLPVITILLTIIFKCMVVTVHHNHLAIRLKFGKYDKLLGPGLHFVAWPYKLLKVRNCKSNTPSGFISLKT